MSSKAEQAVSRSLRAVLSNLPDGAAIGDSKELRSLLCALDYFVPQVLSELHPEWRYESLDGVIPYSVGKLGDQGAEILGLCCIISDQSLTPIHLRLQIPASANEVSWLDCRLGEKGPHGMLRIPIAL